MAARAHHRRRRTGGRSAVAASLVLLLLRPASLAAQELPECEIEAEYVIGQQYAPSGGGSPGGGDPTKNDLCVQCVLGFGVLSSLGLPGLFGGSGSTFDPTDSQQFDDESFDLGYDRFNDRFHLGSVDTCRSSPRLAAFRAV
jgi:hypothetical protein